MKQGGPAFAEELEGGGDGKGALDDCGVGAEVEDGVGEGDGDVAAVGD